MLVGPLYLLPKSFKARCKYGRGGGVWNRVSGIEIKKRLRKKKVLTNLINPVIAGFFTGGALAVRGGMKAARNSAIGCACLLAVIEGVGIGIQRMMAENTRLDVSSVFS